jgi:hypothetical protein
MPVIATTRAMLVLGHKAPMKVSAIACRTDPNQESQRLNPRGKFLGASDAAKTTSKLVSLSKMPRIILESSAGSLLEAVAIKASDYSLKWIAAAKCAFLDHAPLLIQLLSCKPFSTSALPGGYN